MTLQEQIEEVEENIYCYQTLVHLCETSHERIRQCVQEGLNKELQILKDLKAKQEA